MSILDLLIYIPLSILAVEAATELIVKSEIFRPLVNRLKNAGPFMEKLLSCGFCTSVWVSMPPALVFAGLTSPVLVIFWLLVFHRGSNYLHNINDKYFDKYYDPRYKDREN